MYKKRLLQGEKFLAKKQEKEKEHHARKREFAPEEKTTPAIRAVRVEADCLMLPDRSVLHDSGIGLAKGQGISHRESYCRPPCSVRSHRIPSYRESRHHYRHYNIQNPFRPHVPFHKVCTRHLLCAQ
jgi:hypothetical protein